MARKPYTMTQDLEIEKNLAVSGANIMNNAIVLGTFANASDYTLGGDLVLDTPTKIDKPDIYESNFVFTNDTLLASEFDITTGVVGLGTNVVLGHANVLTTGATTNDLENTIGEAKWLRANLCEMTAIFNIDDITDVNFDIGFYIDANNHVLLAFDTATDTNLMLQVTAAGSAERIDTGVPPVNGTDVKMKLIVAADGTPTLYLDDVLIDLSTLTEKMVAAAHKSHWMAETLVVAGAARVMTVSYVKIAQA